MREKGFKLKKKKVDIEKYATFGCRLIKAMEVRGIRNKPLANELEISPQALSAYRCGNRGPDVNQLAIIVRRLNISADYLLGLTEIMDVE